MLQYSILKKPMTFVLLCDYLKYAVVFLMFCIPLGPTIKTIGIVVACLSILMLPQYRKNLRSVYLKSFFISAGLLLGFTALSSFWSAAEFPEQLSIFEKYSKLLFIPLFALGFQKPNIRSAAMLAFLISMNFICLISFIKLFALHSPEPDKIFNNHIQTGFMMAFACYLASCFWIRAGGKKRWWYAGMVIAFSLQLLLVSTSRTAYILYAILLVFFLLQYSFLKETRKKLLLGILCYAFVLGIAGFCSMIYFNLNNNIKQRTQDVVVQVRQYHAGQKNTGIGYRFQFHEYAKTLVQSKPILGHGIGGFSQRYYLENPIPNWPGHPDTHSQYWLIMSEFGLIGILLLMGFFMNLFLISLRLKEMKSTLQALLLLIFVGGFSECVLINSSIGYFFITMVGLCLGEYVEQSQKKPCVEKYGAAVLA